MLKKRIPIWDYETASHSDLRGEVLHEFENIRLEITYLFFTIFLYFKSVNFQELWEMIFCNSSAISQEFEMVSKKTYIFLTNVKLPISKIEKLNGSRFPNLFKFKTIPTLKTDFHDKNVFSKNNNVWWLTSIR